MTINLAIVFLGLIVFACVVGFMSKRKNRNPYFWGTIALIPVLNAIVAVIIIFLPSLPDPKDGGSVV